MKDSTTIEIPLSKTKLAKMLLFSILFSAIGLWMIIVQPEISNPVFNSFFVKTIAAYGAAIMGVFGIYFFAKKMFDKRPGIIINGDGIIDNSGVSSAGLIPWENIHEIFAATIHASFGKKHTFITIALKDPDEYIMQQPNSMLRKLLQLNLKNYGSPVHISTNGLKIAPAELLQLMNERLQDFRSTN